MIFELVCLRKHRNSTLDKKVGVFGLDRTWRIKNTALFLRELMGRDGMMGCDGKLLPLSVFEKKTRKLH